MLASLVGDLGTANDDFARRAARLLQRCRAAGRFKMNADTPQRAHGHGGDQRPAVLVVAHDTRHNAHEVAWRLQPDGGGQVGSGRAGGGTISATPGLRRARDNDRAAYVTITSSRLIAAPL